MSTKKAATTAAAKTDSKSKPASVKAVRRTVTKKRMKKLTAYNVFMTKEVPRLKKENPAIGHKDAFKLAAQNWKSSDDNPKNKS